MSEEQPQKQRSSSQIADEQRLAGITEATNVVSELTAQQRRWLIRYLLHGNATKAAEEAGYTHPGKQGPRLRKNPKILAAIDEYFHTQEMSAKEVVARLSNQARGSLVDFIRFPTNEHGEDIWGIDPHLDLRKAKRANKLDLIKKFKQKRTTRIDKDGVETQDEYTEIELYDAQAALVQVGRYHGLFTEKIDANVATNDSGMTVDEWKAAVEKRRQEAAETLAQFEDDDDAGDDYDDGDAQDEGETP
jgi:hypothetical protein